MTGATCPRCGAPLPVLDRKIRVISVVLTTPAQEQEGLLAWAQIDVDPWRLGGLAVRRRRHDGALTVTFPARRDQQGGLHREITPLDPDLGRDVRAAVIAAYIDERRRAGRRPL